MFSLRLLIGQYPKLFFTLYSLKKYNRRLFIKKDTQLVVNAYPRCGNTYFYYAIKFLNPDLRISHHLHVPSLTIKAVKKELPTVIIIREPSKAIASLLIREDHLTMSQAFKLYKSFHEIVLNNSTKILIFNFDQVVGDFKTIIFTINRRFNLGLNNFKEFTPQEKNKIFANIEQIDKKTNTLNKLSENKVSRPSNNAKIVDLKKEYQLKALVHEQYKHCFHLYKSLCEIASQKI